MSFFFNVFVRFFFFYDHDDLLFSLCWIAWNQDGGSLLEFLFVAGRSFFLS